jgi:hypothetical protein
MGIFSRGTRQSAMKGSPPMQSDWTLPRAPRHQYMTDMLPSTSRVRVFNVAWLQTEMANGTLVSTSEQASRIQQGHSDEAESLVVSRTLAAYVLQRLDQVQASDALLQELTYSAWLGAGFAKLEQAASQQRRGVVHPSIWNGIVRAGGVGAEADTPPQFSQLCSLACEGGYSASRNGLSADQVFRECQLG